MTLSERRPVPATVTSVIFHQSQSTIHQLEIVQVRRSWSKELKEQTTNIMVQNSNQPKTNIMVQNNNQPSISFTLIYTHHTLLPLSHTHACWHMDADRHLVHSGSETHENMYRIWLTRSSTVKIQFIWADSRCNKIFYNRNHRQLANINQLFNFKANMMISLKCNFKPSSSEMEHKTEKSVLKE